LSRADKYSLEQKKTEIYTDFLNSFEQNPLTGALARVTNEESVKQALKNIVLTNIGERFYDSNKGSKIKQSLFELYDPSTIEIIRIQLGEAIAAYEPRAIIQDIRLQEDLDNNGYYITLVFSIINIPDQTFSLDLSIQRVR
jgi:phage baseplate assembly protein W